MNQRTVIFLGPQGSGKGTQIAQLEEFLLNKEPSLQIVRFAAGRTLRPFSEGDSYSARLVKPIIAAGELVPLFVTSGLFAKYLLDTMQGEEHLILDGFPRNEDQIPDLDSALRFYKREKPVVIHITLTDATAIARLLKRGRNDDTPDAIGARLRWTREQLDTILQWFRNNKYYQVIDIDGDRTIDDIQKDIRQKLDLE